MAEMKVAVSNLPSSLPATAQVSFAGNTAADGDTLDYVHATSSVTAQVWASGVLTSASITIQGSLDGLRWFDLGTVDFTEIGTQHLSVGPHAVRYYRGNLTSIVGTATITVTFMAV